MARQDRLESLADPETTMDELLGHRAVAGFIRELLDTLHPQLLVAADMVQREQDGLPALGEQHGDPYMDLSPDLDDPKELAN